MLSGKLNASPRIDVKKSDRSGDTTGESNFARRIEEQQDAFADPVSLTARPQARPLRDRDVVVWL